MILINMIMSPTRWRRRYWKMMVINVIIQWNLPSLSTWTFTLINDKIIIILTNRKYTNEYWIMNSNCIEIQSLSHCLITVHNPWSWSALLWWLICIGICNYAITTWTWRSKFFNDNNMLPCVWIDHNAVAINWSLMTRKYITKLNVHFCYSKFIKMF